jgi:subtilisin family serine protease
VPRNSINHVVPNPPENLLFAPMSGTSMATPLVAGAAALVIGREKSAGRPWDPASVKNALLSNVNPSRNTPNVSGGGYLDISAF